MAEADAGGAAAGGGQASPYTLLPAILAITALYIFMIIRPQRKQNKAQKDLLGNLKKNDRVVTIGGIYGVVTNVQRESDEVTLKVDEATNTKLRVTIASIAKVIADTESGEKANKT